MIKPPCAVISAEVAVAPDVVEALEVGGAVLAAVGVVPEADRHHREGLGAHQLALLAAHRAAVVVEHVDRHAQPAALDLAAPHRQHRDCRARSRR
jgi:hypothetical protein